MIDPENITDFSKNQSELEEVILFWVCAAGKNGKTAARCLNDLLGYLKVVAGLDGKKPPSPFALIRYFIEQEGAYRPFLSKGFLKSVRRSKGIKRNVSKRLADVLKAAGIGCYNYKANTFFELAYSDLDLQTCSLDQLESISGIGPKTARCFLIHSRPNQRYAGLDTHILKFLREQGIDVPKSTPSGAKYLRLEQEFIKLADKAGKSVAEYDLELWNYYSKKAG